MTETPEQLRKELSNALAGTKILNAIIELGNLEEGLDVLSKTLAFLLDTHIKNIDSFEEEIEVHKKILEQLTKRVLYEIEAKYEKDIASGKER